MPPWFIVSPAMRVLFSADDVSLILVHHFSFYARACVGSNAVGKHFHEYRSPFSLLKKPASSTICHKCHQHELSRRDIWRAITTFSFDLVN